VEVPHFASLRDGERDVMVLRSDDGVRWYEHTALTTGGAVHNVFSDSFEGEGDYRSVHVFLTRFSLYSTDSRSLVESLVRCLLRRMLDLLLRRCVDN